MTDQDNTDGRPERPEDPQIPAWPGLPDSTRMWQSDGPGPQPVPPPVRPPADERSGSRSWKIAVAVLVALLVAGGGTLAAVLLGRSSGSPQASGSSRPGGSVDGSNAAASAMPAQTPIAAPTSLPAPSVVTRSVYVTSAPTTRAQEQTQTYSGPGGISVQGPAGWVEDDSANLSSIRDYVPPSSRYRLSGANIRIGIGNGNPKSTIESEAAYSIGYLRKSLGGYVSGPTYVAFRGRTAADIDWEFTNDMTPHVQRRGRERIWIENGVTMIVISSDLSSRWSSAVQVFGQVTSTVEIS